MQFKKGSFEVGSVVYPVAIKVYCVLIISRLAAVLTADSLKIVRRAVYRRFLEFQSSFDDSVPLHDDVFVGLSV